MLVPQPLCGQMRLVFDGGPCAGRITGVRTAVAAVKGNHCRKYFERAQRGSGGPLIYLKKPGIALRGGR